MDSADPHLGHFIVLLCGIPGSGKSSFANFLKSRSDCYFGLDCTVLCFDDDFLPNHDEIISTQRSYSQGREKALKSLKELCLSDSKIRLIVVDDNMYYRSMRKEVYKIARDCKCLFTQVFFEISVEAALERNRMRENPVPEDAVRGMAEKLEPPAAKTGWDQAIAFSSNEEVAAVLAKKWKEHPTLKPKASMEKDSNNNNVKEKGAHELDMLLRKEVGTILSRVSGKPPESLVKSLAELRRVWIKKFKDGDTFGHVAEEFRKAATELTDE